MSGTILRPSPLTAEAFAPFGDVIETEGRPSIWINEGTCRRFDDLARIDVLESSGRPVLSVFEANPRPLPLRVRALERHPLSSQAFFPLGLQTFLIVVAHDGTPRGTGIRVFLSSGRQGVNYRRNTWHHPLLALGHTSRFLVVDRGGPEENCERMVLDEAVFVEPER